MKHTHTIVSRTLRAAVVVSLLGGVVAWAQDGPAEGKPAKQGEAETLRRTPERFRDTNQDPYKTFFLKAGPGANDANELLTSLRLMLDPSTKIYLVPSLKAILVRGTPESLALAEKILGDIDRTKKVYKLTYTITESEAGKKLGVQRFTMALVSGGRTTLKNGSKVPVATGSYSSGNSSAQTQFTYLDVGLNFDSTIDEAANGITLRSKVEQSSAAEEKLLSGVQEPIIRQSVLEGTSILLPGQPLMLGSLDIAGSTRHLDVEVVLEPSK